jgi:hypothetical protein
MVKETVFLDGDRRESYKNQKEKHGRNQKKEGQAKTKPKTK